MNSPYSISEPSWKGIILVLSGAVLLLTVWCLSHGITTIFMHLYYFPIVLLAYRYRWKGFAPATLLALAYLVLVIAFDPGQWDVIVGAFYRFLVFVGIAAVIAYLSDRLFQTRDILQQTLEVKDQYLSLAPAIILVLDRNGTITFLSQKGCEILDCIPEEVHGKSWSDTFLPEKERERIQTVFSQLVAGHVEPNRVIENLVLTGGGTEKIIRWNNTVLHDESGFITGILGYGEDITEEKWAQNALRKMQQFQESVIANANVWISVLAADGTLLVWNDAAEAISGYKKTDVLGKKTVWRQLYPDPAYRKKVTGDIQRIIGRDTYLENFETRVRCADGTTRTLVWNTRSLREESGTISSYIAIGRDITEQIDAEARASESSRFLSAMVETLPVPIFFKDAKGRYLSCNSPFEEYIGIKKSDLIGKTAYDISPKDLADVYSAADRKVFDHPVQQRYETQVQYADGSRHDVIFYKAPYLNQDGSVGGIIGTFLDITDRKAAEDRIRDLLHVQEEQLRIINTSPAIAFLWKAEENWPVESVSENISQFGYTREDFISGRVLFSSIIHPEDLGRVGAEVEYNSSHQIDYFFQEYRIFGKNEDLFWIADYTHIRRDAIGKITHYEGIVLDITRRKQVEELRTATQYRLDTAMEIGKLAWWEMDMPDGSVRFDDRKATMLGYSPEKFRHYRDFTALLHPDDLEPIMLAMRNHLEGKAVRYQGDYRIRAFSGDYLWFRDVGGITKRHTDGSPATLTGVVIDITASKQADLALKETNDYLTSLFDYANAPIIVWDPEFRITRFNHAFEHLTGRTENEVRGQHISLLFPEKSRESSLEQIRETLAGVRWESVEIPILRVSGEERTVLWNSATIYTDDGENVLATIAQGQDITGRKQMEAAFHESRQLFMDIISFLPDATFVIDKEGTVIAWNRTLEQLSGVAGREIIGKRDHEYSLWSYGKRRPVLIDLVLDPDKDAARLNYTDIRWDGRTVTAQSIVTPAGSGKKVPLSAVASPLLDAEGRVTGAIESMRDISRLKEAEAELERFNANQEKIIRERTQALREEIVQRKYAEQEVQDTLAYTRSVIEANPDLMVVLDQKGTVLDVNTATESLTGVSREQLVGTPYSRYLVDNSTPTDILVQLREKGRLNYTVPLQRADGHITPLSVNATLFRGKDGTDARIIVAGHDITRQKLDEAAIKAALDEQVILLREVHHRVKNNLQIIISLTNLQMRQADDPKVKQIMSETQNRVKAMSLVHEKLYRSESLSRIDFGDYTRFLATQLFSFYGMDTRRVRLEFSLGKIMVDIVTAVPLGLLMNELISNALKHGFPQGREGTISISGGYDGDYLSLSVRDNGVGLPKDLDWKNTASLGMRLVNSLVEQVDGQISLDRETGTAFTITVKCLPESEERGAMPLSGKG